MKRMHHHDDMDDASDSDEEVREAIALAGPGTFVERVQKVHTCDNKGLLARLEEFGSKLPWAERLDVSCDAAPAPPGSELDFDSKEVDPKDDFKRELLFYRMAQSASAVGLARLKELGVPTKRPDDYLAEMVKSDDHMARVRAKLVARQQDLQTREKAKALRQQKKFAKQSQAEATLRKQEERRNFNDALKKMKKVGAGSADFEGVLGVGAGKKQRQQSLEDTPMLGSAKSRRRSNKKRDYKNQKWGFGGQKKRSKYNTKESARSFAAFKTAKHGATGKKAAKMMQQAPGKNKNKVRGRRR